MYATAGQNHVEFSPQFWRQLGPGGTGAGKRLARIRGRLRMIVALRTQAVDIPDLAQGIGHHYALGGAQLILKNIAPATQFPQTANGTFVLPFSVERPRPQPSEWVAKARFSASLRFYIFDEFGNELETQSRNWLSVAIPPNQYFPGPHPREMLPAGRPTRLRIEAPTAVKHVEVPFEFTDIPLPTPRTIGRKAGKAP
jgi:hypothetical protein